MQYHKVNVFALIYLVVSHSNNNNNGYDDDAEDLHFNCHSLAAALFLCVNLCMREPEPAKKRLK